MVDDLIAWLDHTFSQEGWHVSVLASVQDLTAAQAAWVPAPERNSIWRIVDHVALWKEEGARRLAGQPPRPADWAKAHDWQRLDQVSEERWQAAVQHLIRAHGAVRASLASMSDEEMHAPAPGSSVPRMETVSGLIAHDSYHCGQICYLRALQGVPVKVW
jgi:uncharacterized damage-inducible protein DinB